MLSKYKEDEIMFSCNDKIYQCDNIQDTNVKIVSKDKIKPIHSNDSQDEIYDVCDIYNSNIVH